MKGSLDEKFCCSRRGRGGDSAGDAEDDRGGWEKFEQVGETREVAGKVGMRVQRCTGTGSRNW